ncbi:MAG: hypothetical protein VBE63_08245 [Lamprobacter sp.]|uniref:hypothetical protein n=1 Tax=Lamprobacter sp. TaxID=3100796 RepID=UPI002B26368C|nr:hypothetical protein [Lamprobacter sp.]MEA3639919.1 hypothetical protein [Lamprobacter sp.]
MADIRYYMDVARNAYERAGREQEEEEAKRKEREAEQWRQQTADKLQAYYQAPGGGLASPQPAMASAGSQGPVPAATAHAPAPLSGGLAQPVGIPDSLVQNESGGNYQARNNVTGAGGLAGHFGKYQFGQARLQDYERATGEKVDPQSFLNSPEQQERVARWHFNDIDRYIQQNGLDQYIGQTVGGVPITQNALRSMAHLGGSAGMGRFLKTGGQYNPADTNGTRLSDYGTRHGGDGGGGQAAGGQAAGPGQQAHQAPDVSRAAQLYQEIVIDAFRHNQLEQAAPVLAQLASKGFAAHMQSFQGDPTTPDGAVEFMWHMGAGAGTFGRDPWEIASQAAGRATDFNRTRQSDQAHGLAQRQETRLSENAETAREDAAFTRELKRQEAGLTRTKLMLQYINAGMVDQATQLAQSLGYDLTNIEEAQTDMPGVGPARTMKFDLVGPDGKSMTTDALTMAGHLGLTSAASSDEARSVSASEQKTVDEALYGAVEAKCAQLPGGQCTSAQRQTLTQELLPQVMAAHQARYKALSTGRPYQQPSGGPDMATIYDQAFGAF